MTHSDRLWDSLKVDLDYDEEHDEWIVSAPWMDKVAFGKTQKEAYDQAMSLRPGRGS